ncbi:MAG: MFS transporter [Candidatus Tectomicrobia bacterium]|uniref:MFS transporter n=1 Tax=Tectimicrobiota bacterium TaxID=2528274 RepID=A0A932HY15_UNCTE|nr:MFS transporter [Candidatus Tectomicrobia bacterium]
MIVDADRLPARAPSFYYGWAIIGLAHLTLAFQVTTRFGFGIFQVPLIEEFGWSRGALGGAFALGLGAYAVAVPYAGSLLERYGPRRVMPWGCVIAGAGMTASFLVSSLWQVYLLSGILTGLGLALSGFGTHSAIMPRWFVRMRGRATGLALAGIGVGTLVLSPAIERAIAYWGWRYAYLLFGLSIVAVIAPLNFLLMRDYPEEKGQGPDGGPPRPPEVLSAVRGGHSGKGIRQVFLAVRGDIRFWAIVLLAFFIGLNANTIMSQLQLYLVDTGYPTATAALIFGAVGFIRMLGSVVGGWMGDGIGRGRGVAAAGGVVVLGLAFLLLLPAIGGGVANGLLYALIYGIGFGAISTCYSALAGDCFEGPTYGVIVGFLEICYGLGGVVGPPLAGLMFDLTGSYAIPFTVIAAGMGGSILIGFFLQWEIDRRKRGPS